MAWKNMRYRSAMSGNRYFGRRCTTKPKKAMTKYIRNVVAASTQQTVTYPRTDPPNFKLDRPFKRRVRVTPAAAATGIRFTDISTSEGAYYGLTSARWQNIKVLAVTAYGLLPQQGDANSNITVTFPNIGANIGATTFNDRGDGNHRPCVKVIEPPTTPLKAADDTGFICTFVAGSVYIVDFYVEFS